MQIVESTSLGVRSVVFTLAADDDKPRFILFPMIHVAEAAFYAEVRRRLEECDLILFEGVPGLAAGIVTLSYRLLAGSARFGLVSQRSALSAKSFGERAMRADISVDAFRREWRRISLPLRALLLVAAPALGIYLRLFGTRESIAHRLGMDLLPSRDEILVHESAEPFLELILHARDRLIVRGIDRHLKPATATIGVVYGGRHMRAIIRFLTEKAGYRITSREFLNVMTL